MIDGKLEKSEIIDKLIINKKFVLIDSSKYTNDVFLYILEQVDKVGSVAFVSDIKKVYAQGQYYSDLDELKYFTTITAKDSDGNVTSPSMAAPGPGSTLTFKGGGLTYISTNPTNGEIIISTDPEIIDNQFEAIIERIRAIETTYATQEYVGDNYQEILIPGAYINISDDNIITTYNLPTLTYLSETYATIAYVTDTNSNLGEFKEEVYNNYATKLYARETAAEAASDAVTKVIDGAADAFDTLKEISDWIVNSGEYIEATDEQITNNPKDKYYIKDAENNYVDAQYDEEGNVIKTEGETLYIYSSTTAADIITNITTLGEEVGDNSSYTLSDGGIFTGATSSLISTGENKYTYQLESGDWVEVTYTPSSGIYKVIDDNVAELNSKITSIAGNIDDMSSILFELTTTSNSSYTYILLTPEVYEGSKIRNIGVNVIEGKFDDDINSSTYGQITINGLATTYTIDAMFSYRNGWVILQGETIE